MSMMDSRYRFAPAADSSDPLHEWVVFANDTDVRLLRFLKRGFRHCFYVRRERGVWIVIDPLAHCTELVHYNRDEIGDLIQLYVQQGLLAVPVRTIRPPRRLAPPMISTCVDAVKRLIGLHRAFIVTPYQLYRHLRKNAAAHISPASSSKG